MNWYRIKKAQYFENVPAGMHYMDFGHKGWGTANEVGFRSNIVKECIWLIDSEFRMEVKCSEDGSKLGHREDWGMSSRLKDGATGRYIEYNDKSSVLTFNTSIPDSDFVGQGRVKRMTEMLDKKFNYPIMYRF